LELVLLYLVLVLLVKVTPPATVNPPAIAATVPAVPILTNNGLSGLGISKLIPATITPNAVNPPTAATPAPTYLLLLEVHLP
jgi:hypothetical protein